MTKKNIKDKKGITLVTLSIAIIIMMIITSTIIYNISTSAKIKALNSMYQDITKLKDKVDLYYSNYHSIPILQTKYENVNQIQSKNPNDSNTYYVIDLEALENLHLTYGQEYEKYKSNPSNELNDLYIMNERSHSIYYVKGIEMDGVMYYTIPEENTKVEVGEILNLEVIGTNRDFANVKMYAVDKTNGIKKLTLIIDEKEYKSYTYDSDIREIKTQIEQIELAKEKRDCYFKIEDVEGTTKTSNHITLGISIAKLEPGDYIQYDTGVTTVGDNGVVMFRVLYPEDSEYGLQIVSDKNVGEQVPLVGSNWEGGKKTYNEAIETLNKEAEKYVNTKYAYDARSVGSIPIVKKGIFVDKNKGTETTVTLPLSNWTNYTRPSNWTSDDTGCLDEDNNYITDQNALIKAEMWITGEIYWLASRFLNAEPSVAGFYIRYAYSNGVLGGGSMCDVYSSGSLVGRSDKFGIRPCISLKSDIIKITDGDGKSPETAYIIGL